MESRAQWEMRVFLINSLKNLELRKELTGAMEVSAPIKEKAGTELLYFARHVAEGTDPRRLQELSTGLWVGGVRWDKNQRPVLAAVLLHLLETVFL